MENKINLKTGVAIVLIGYQGSGKTPRIKELMKTANMPNNIAFDPRGEYDPNEFTIFHNFKVFKDFIFKVKNSFIIFEEATGYIGSFSDIELQNLLIGVEHNRNIIVFAFHSIKRCPLFLLELSRFIILLDTQDSPESVKRDRPLLYPYMNMKKPVLIDVRKIKF